jgi:hypothetical protein
MSRAPTTATATPLHRSAAARVSAADALLAAGGGQRLTVARFLREYGPFVLAAYLLATARWGSYLLPGPPYIGDLFVAALVGERLLAAARGRRALEAVEWTIGISCGSLLVWSSLRFFFGGISTNAIRDFAPYAYAVVVFLTPSRARSDEQRATLERWLFGALLFHAVWVTVSLISPSFVTSLPVLGGGQSQVFQLRPDVDSTICGVLIVYCLHRVATGRQPGLSLAIAAWNTVLVLDDYSRAAIAAVVAQLVLFVVLTPAAREVVRRYSLRLLVPVLIVLVPAVAYEASRSDAVKRLSQASGSFLPLVPTTGDPTGGTTGTAAARRRAWQAIEIYLEANPGRNWRGVGFGPNFLHDSGGDQLLLGGSDEDVRQPHDYLVNTWARLGLVGLGMVAIILLIGLRIAVRIGRLPGLGGVDVMAIAIATGMPVAGFYGVVLESPFGALPFWWALAYLGSRAIELRVSAPWPR